MRLRLFDHKSKASVLALISLIAFLSLRQAMVQAQSAKDGFDPNADNWVSVIALQQDGKVLVAGTFTQLGGQTRMGIGRLNPDGTLDAAFNPTPSGRINAIAVQPDGKIIVGGAFTQLNGQPRSRIGRLNSDGSLDTSFNPGANSEVYALALQVDGKILAGGVFNQLGGLNRYYIGRLNSNGSIDPSFNPAADSFVLSLALQKDGKIVLSGFFSALNGQGHSRIGRLNADGSVDSSFNPVANNSVYEVALQADGKVLLSGFFTQLNGLVHNRIGRLNPDGSLDISFNPEASAFVGTIAVQPDGKILLAGMFNQLNGQFHNLFGRLNSDGSLDTSFNPSLLSGVSAVVLQADGKILIGGTFTEVNSQSRNRIARLNPDGSLDATLNPTPFGSVDAIALQTDGKILIGGSFTMIGGQTRNRLGRLIQDGSLDTSFNPGADNVVRAIAVQPDGKILVCGDFTQLGGQTHNRIGRLNPDGSLDDRFNPDANNGVFGLAVQQDGKILVVGVFSQLNGKTRTGLGRLNSDGSLDTDFKPSTNDFVVTIALQADGKILIGGDFTQLEGQTRNRIGRLNSDGSIDNSFNPSANDQVATILVQPDGKILVGGSFTQLGGQIHNRIGRLNSDGSLQTFNPGLNDPVRTLALQSDGKIFAGMTGLLLGGVTRIFPNGSVDTSFTVTTGGPVNAIAVQADGRVLVGGGFGGLGAEHREFLGRLTNTGAAFQNLSVAADGSTIQWLRSGASPEVNSVTFESSSDGLNYSLIGAATHITGGWQLTGPSLPRAQDIFIRARGFYATGGLTGSSSVVESVRNIFVPAVTPACPGTPGGIISWWPAEGNLLDIVGHSDGTLQNGATFAAGTVGRAFSLDGIDDAIVINNSAALNPTSISVDAWVKPNNVPVGTLQDVVTKWGFDAARDGYFLGLLNDGSGIRVLGAIGDGATGDSGLLGGTLTVNTWNHIAMTYDAASGSNRLYLNGVLLSQRVRANGVFPTTTRVFIGGEDSDQSRFFSGLIDEPTIYSRALTDSEVLAIFNAGSNGKCGAVSTPPSPGSAAVQFSASNYNVQEDCTLLTITVNRFGDTSGAASVEYNTADVTASERKDYISTSGKLQFAPGETAKTFAVLINEDSLVEGNETFNVTLSNPAGMSLGGPGSASVTIIDDASEPAANVIDDPRNFVCQQYHDFLNRQPDQSGWDFWTSEITSCGGNASCIELKRINVSAAFYLSIEFQETGYLIERFYKTAYFDAIGDSTSPTRHSLQVPIVRFNDFLLDQRQIAKGVVVNVGDWRQQLELNKQAFALEFVQRSRFTNALPTSLTPAEFVDALNSNAGNVLSPSERTTAIDLFGGAGNTADVGARSRALLQVAKDSDLDHAETNRAFVLMQFLGYLRRNPDDLQDIDFTGYEFWLSKLNDFNGSFINAEMVKAFLVSVEYRNRFGP